MVYPGGRWSRYKVNCENYVAFMESRENQQEGRKEGRKPKLNALPEWCDSTKTPEGEDSPYLKGEEGDSMSIRSDLKIDPEGKKCPNTHHCLVPSGWDSEIRGGV